MRENKREEGDAGKQREEQRYKTKQICENSCLLEDEKFPSMENVLKFTENIEFPIPRSFLESIDRDPSGYHDFMATKEYDFVLRMINGSGLSKHFTEDLIKQSAFTGLKINFEVINFFVIIKNQPYWSKMDYFRRVPPDSITGERVQNYFRVDYDASKTHNIVWAKLADVLLPAEAAWSDSSQAKAIDPKGNDITILQVGVTGDATHVIFLLIDRNKKTVQYFDSYMTGIDLIYKQLKRMLTGYEFTDPITEGCPRGLQGTKNPTMMDVYCRTWVLFVEYLYLMNYGKPLQEFLGYLLTVQGHALDILLAFSYYLYETYKDEIVEQNKNYGSKLSRIAGAKEYFTKALDELAPEDYKEYMRFLVSVGDMIEEVYSSAIAVESKYLENTLAFEVGRGIQGLYDEEVLYMKNTYVNFRDNFESELFVETFDLDTSLNKWKKLEKSLPPYMKKLLKIPASISIEQSGETCVYSNITIQPRMEIYFLHAK